MRQRVMFVDPNGRHVSLPDWPQPINPDAAKAVWDQALCAQIDPELFFPDRGDMPGSRLAKGICERCPVRQTCLQTFGPALSHGVVGGRTAKERRRDPADDKVERRSA